MASDVPAVDVIVGVHNGDRPIERAVRSVLASTVHVRVSVVAHNVGTDVIARRLGELVDDPRVRILSLQDGVRSPANAFNRGLDAATGTYVAIVGSDDSLEAGALDAWVALAERHAADAVIAPIIRDGDHAVPTPRIRDRRRVRVLDADRDRVFERTAALGIQRRKTTDSLRYATGLPRGVDQEFGLRLWTTKRIVFDPATPVYREHADQNDRVTHAFGPLIEDFAFLDGIESAVAGLALPLRRAVVAKLVRVHLVPAVSNRARAKSLDTADLDAADDILRRLSALAPGMQRLLPRALRGDLAAIRHRSVAEAVDVTRRSRSRLTEVLPDDPWLFLHRHAPLRSLSAGRSVMRRTQIAYAARRPQTTAPDDGGPR
ncbi:glycosyltransferase family 2 protein [Microbacterium sp. SSW1-49]|uniref:Glycosyltransferase family 2 protein n=1 Tax=Microbacterium croceum TaxID=2851645 RepID=A0ABT0FE27_9MICO|nr:glycosyltransferase family 2 protein [Microbacterium croceum]MCK2036323.1 glycosyltransferase family 2 protein [Microbacterium croceum]